MAMAGSNMGCRGKPFLPKYNLFNNSLANAHPNASLTRFVISAKLLEVSTLIPG
jgi:hypothetical protein